MPELPSTQIRFDTLEFRHALIEAPQILNQHINAGMRKAGSGFSREFAKTRLTKAGGFNVKRKGAVKPAAKHQPKVSKKFYRAGLRASLAGQGRDTITRLYVAAHNPLLIQREEGATLPEAGPGRMLIEQTRKGARGKGRYRVASRVRIPATLRFAETFGTYMPGAGLGIVEKEIGRGFTRIERIKARGGKLK